MINSFKISKKEIYKDSRTTLIAKHNETISAFEKEKEKLPEYIKKLNFLKGLRETKLQNNKQNDIEVTKLQTEIDNIEIKIKRIQDDTDLTEYLFKSIESIPAYLIDSNITGADSNKSKPLIIIDAEYFIQWQKNLNTIKSTNPAPRKELQ